MNVIHKTASGLVALLVILSVTVAPAAAALEDSPPYDDGRSSAADEIGGIAGYSIPDYVKTYGGAGDNIGVFVTYQEGEYSALNQFVNGSNDREILDKDNASNRALVKMPVRDTGLSFIDRLLNNGLLSQSYVESIAINQQVELIDPVENLEDNDVWEKPGSKVSRFGNEGEFTTEGVAFGEDTNETPLEDSISRMNPPDDATINGTGVTVAVLDTGVNTNNGKVFGNGSAGSSTRITKAKNFITNETATSASNFDNVSDGNLHGSWVAAAIAANVSQNEYDGIAPGASLMIGKVLDDDGGGDTQQVIDGIEWATENNADIISMSLGSPVYSPVLADEMREFLNNGGTAIVVAAGNNRMTTRFITSPADVPEDGVISVAATTPDKAVENASSMYFSAVGPDPGVDGSRLETRGQSPDVGAPGANLTARIPRESGSLTNKTLSGTSMATPLVAGGIALMLEQNPGMSNQTTKVAGYVANTSKPMPEAGVTEVGNGMLDANNLTTKTENEATQEESRDADAEGRDLANRALAKDNRGIIASTRRSIFG